MGVGREAEIKYETSDMRIRVFGDAAVVTGRLQRTQTLKILLDNRKVIGYDDWVTKGASHHAGKFAEGFHPAHGVGGGGKKGWMRLGLNPELPSDFMSANGAKRTFTTKLRTS